MKNRYIFEPNGHGKEGFLKVSVWINDDWTGYHNFPVSGGVLTDYRIFESKIEVHDSTGEVTTYQLPFTLNEDDEVLTTPVNDERLTPFLDQFIDQLIQDEIGS